MRHALSLSLALLALPMLAAAQQPAAKPAPTIRTISEAKPQNAMPIPAAQPRPPLDPTSFCYFADRAYSLGAHITDLVCTEGDRGSMIFENGKKDKPVLVWKKAQQ